MKEIQSSYKQHKIEIKSKLEEFSKLNQEDYLYELIFCILTPQSKAEKCWQAVQELKKCKLEKGKIENCLKTKTRFYRNKTKYLIEASKKWGEIKKELETENPIEIRRFLVKNVKGLGMKEASHFIRNIGKSNNHLAILDRHILRKLQELKIINKIPNLTEKNYLETENKMKDFSKKTNIPLDDLDLLFWKIESGRIFK